MDLVNTLSPAELFRVEKKVKNLADERRREKYLPKMSGRKIVAKLNESYEQSLRGETYSEEVVLEEVSAILKI